MGSRHTWIVLVVLAAVLAGTQVVAAYGKVRRSDPAPGARLTLAPAEVFIWFNEPPREGSSISVFDSEFKDVAAGQPRIDPDDATLMRLPLKPLAPGRYTVRWRAQTDTGSYSGTHDFILEGPPLPISVVPLVAGGAIAVGAVIAVVVIRAARRHS
jgi:methionine-rich copper-binding protein CopC